MPYQLHAWIAAHVEVRLDETELEERIDELELITDDEERNDDDEARDEEGIERDDGALDESALEDTGGVEAQIAPVTAGVSMAAPLEFTCTPKDTFWPGWILPFQCKLVAE